MIRSGVEGFREDSGVERCVGDDMVCDYGVKELGGDGAGFGGGEGTV